MKRISGGTPSSGHKKHKGSNSKEASSEEQEDLLRFEADKPAQQLSNGQVRAKACPWMAKKTTDIRDPLLRFHN